MGSIGPSFIDHVGDVEHRDEIGYTTSIRYQDDSGRNDIVVVKVARDLDNAYFYAQTSEPLASADNSSNWMLLFIDVDGNSPTGWERFDVVVNRRVNNSLTSDETSEFSWVWRLDCQITVVAIGKELQFAVPRSSFGFSSTNSARINFKWVDNMILDADILSLINDGDTAPNGRLSYVFDD